MKTKAYFTLSKLAEKYRSKLTPKRLSLISNGLMSRAGLRNKPLPNGKPSSSDKLQSALSNAVGYKGRSDLSFVKGLNSNFSKPKTPEVKADYKKELKEIIRGKPKEDSDSYILKMIERNKRDREA